MADDAAASTGQDAPLKAVGAQGSLFGAQCRELGEVRTVRDGAGATIIVSWGDTCTRICYEIATNTVAIIGDSSRPLEIFVNGNKIQRG